MITRFLRNNTFPLLAGLSKTILLIVYFVSSYRHLENPYGLLSSIYDYKIGNSLLGSSFGYLLALILPFVEAVIAMCILTSVSMRAAVWTSILLVSIFFIAQSIVIFNGLDIDCGCFGVDSTGSSKVSYISLAKLIVLMFASVVILKFDKSEKMM